MTTGQLLALLRGEDLGHILFGDVDDDEEYMSSRRRRRAQLDPNRFPKVPSDEGTQLMNSGIFGSSDREIGSRKQLARRILDRELGLGDRISRKINQDIIAQVGGPSRMELGVSMLTMCRV